MPVISKTAIELEKLLSDSEWHKLDVLAVIAGKYIREEIARRRAISGRVIDGRRRYIQNTLIRWRGYGRVESRGQGKEWKKLGEWHVGSNSHKRVMEASACNNFKFIKRRNIE